MIITGDGAPPASNECEGSANRGGKENTNAHHDDPSTPVVTGSSQQPYQRAEGEKSDEDEFSHLLNC